MNEFIEWLIEVLKTWGLIIAAYLIETVLLIISVAFSWCIFFFVVMAITILIVIANVGFYYYRN